MRDGLNRRRLLSGTLGVAAAATAGAAPGEAQTKTKIAKPAIGRGLPDVAVIGAGAFGGWAALTLRERGYRTTLVDAYGPGNPHASSGGETRNIRAGYGDREIYSDWAAKAWVLWHQREEEFGRKLIYPSGSLRDPGPKDMAAQVAVFEKLKLPYEMLTPNEVAKRWPQIRTDDIPKIFYDIKSGGVKARETSIAVVEMFERKGGQTKLGYATIGDSAGGKLKSVLVDGEPLHAGEFVFACGPWLPKLFPGFMGSKLQSPRVELFFVAPARGDQRFRWDNCPSISDQITYTTADIGGGYKVASRLGPTMMDPDDGDRMPTHFLVQQVERYVKLRLPGLVGRPILQAYVCQTEQTDTGHFIIDRHPDFANALIAGGGSGHAFKMGPYLGPYIADRIAGKPQDPYEKKIFSLAEHGDVTAPRGRRNAEMTA